MTAFLVTLEPNCPPERAEQIKDAVRMVRGVASVEGRSDKVHDGEPEALISIKTVQIAGRGTIKILSANGLRRQYKVGDDIRIDGHDWTISASAMRSPTIGLFVRAKTSAAEHRERMSIDCRPDATEEGQRMSDENRKLWEENGRLTRQLDERMTEHMQTVERCRSLRSQLSTKTAECEELARKLAEATARADRAAANSLPWDYLQSVARVD
jgi:hypothetical protein